MAKRSRSQSRDRSRPSRETAWLNQAPGRGAIAIALVAFSVIFAGLEVGSYTQKSAVWDEPIHMTDAYASLAQHDYRIDPEHPPFLRMWAAAPLLFMNVTAVDLATVDATPPTVWARTLFSFCERFLYLTNDADRLLYASRFMSVLLGIALGLLLFSWANEWLGFWPAAVALACYTVEPNIAAHASLVTTDFGLVCFAFATVYALWRACRTPSPLNIAGAALAFALAIASKYSAVVLIPLAAALIVVMLFRRAALTPLKALVLVVALGATAWIGLWAVYGFRYAPSRSSTWLYDFSSDTQVLTEVPSLAPVVGWIDRHHLLPNTFSQGFLFGQAKAQKRPAFIDGEFGTEGWWYYFPFAMLIKTPVGILLLGAAGLAVAVRRWAKLELTTLVFVLLPIATFLGSGMVAHINIGLRHVLPIYPFIFMLVAVAASEAFAARTPRAAIVMGVLLAAAATEYGTNYPDNLAFFNVFVGGASHGAEYLVDSNLDWGQDLKPLKRWMDANHVTHINLSYFGTADPAYYHMNVTYLPGSERFANDSNVQLPGYVALSATLLNGVYLGEQERAFYRPFQSLKPVASIGHSINVYWVDRPWW